MDKVLELERASDWILEKTPEIKNKQPSRFQVILLNDDYTPMDFVVYVLQRFYDKSFEEATKLMLDVHTKGEAICGEYTRDIAETKIAVTMEFAAKHEHPLQCRMRGIS